MWRKLVIHFNKSAFLSPKCIFVKDSLHSPVWNKTLPYQWYARSTERRVNCSVMLNNIVYNVCRMSFRHTHDITERRVTGLDGRVKSKSSPVGQKWRQSVISLSTKSYLINHTMKHTGEKPYNCKQCDKALSMKIRLINHRKTHTEQKWFKCNLCDKVFS